MSNNYGWICPRCFKVHSPFSLTCDCPPATNTTSSYFTDSKPLDADFQEILNETYKKQLKSKPKSKL